MYQLHWRFALSFFSLYLSARRNMFLVCSVASVIKESINMAKKENTWTMIPTGCLLRLHLSEVIWMFMSALQIQSPTSQPFNFSALLLFPFKSHRYPEQHDKNNNALFTGQYIVTVQLSLAVDLWICLLGFIHLTTVNLWGQQIWKSAVMKTIDYNSVHKLFSNPNFSHWFLIIKQFLSMWLHYMLNSYHCTDYGICFFLFITVDLWIKTKMYVVSASTCHISCNA